MIPATIHPAFWTGRTGRAMRDLPSEVRDTAFYLLTGPEKTAFGLFMVEPDQIARNTGRKEKAIHEALEHLVDLAFCRWDDASGWVWVIEMAHYQFQAPLKPADYRVGAAKKWYRAVIRNPFLSEWWDRYARDFHLDTDPYPAERRESFHTGAIPGAAPPPSKGLAQPRTEEILVQQDPSTSLFGADLQPLRARESVVDIATRPLSRAGVEESFEQLWQQHPNGKQKKDALIEWRKLKLTPKLLEEIQRAHASHLRSYDWTKAAGQYVPRMVNWIKKHGWLDRVAEQAPVILSEKNARNVAAANAASSRPFREEDDE